MQRTFWKANGRLVAAGLGAVSLLALNSGTAKATEIESWEGSLDGWLVPSPAGSNTTYSPAIVSGAGVGVTDGVDSLAVGSPTTAPNYSQLLLGPSLQSNTSILGNASGVQLDIYTPPASFGFFLQFDMDINNADTGFVSLDGFSYPSTVIGSETTLTFPITSALAATLKASSNPTTIVIQVGGGFSAGNETMYLDNLRSVDLPEPASLGLLGGSLMLLGRRRRKAC